MPHNMVILSWGHGTMGSRKAAHEESDEDVPSQKKEKK